jgi:hypothetical protein
LHLTAWKIPYVRPWEINPLGVLFLFFSLNKWKIKHYPELNSETSWTPNLWKAFLCLAMLREVVAISPHWQAPNLLA